MDPVALWEQMLASAEQILRLTAGIARKEEKGIPPNESDFNELNDEADSLAMDVLDMNEWIEKGGFPPFDKKEDESAREDANLERDLEYRDPYE